MPSCILFENLNVLKSSNTLSRQALTVLTVSDHILTGEVTTSDERQTTFNDMMVIALEDAIQDSRVGIYRVCEVPINGERPKETKVIFFTGYRKGHSPFLFALNQCVNKCLMSPEC